MLRGTNPSLHGIEVLKNNQGDSVALLANFSPNGFLLFRAEDESAIPLAFSTTSDLHITDTVGEPILKMYFDNARTRNSPVFDLIDDSGKPLDPRRDTTYKRSWEYVGEGYPYRPSTAIFDQGAPYNTYVTGAAGCLTTAIAQLFSHYKYPSEIGGHKIPWDNCLRNDLSPDSSHSVALLFKNIYEECIIRVFGESMGRKEDGVKYLKKHGFNTQLSTYNAENIMDYIVQNKKPVIMYGWASFLSRHYWVLDGYAERYYDIVLYKKYGRGYWRRVGALETRTVKYFHCNWGWGGKKNGYFYKNSFNSTDGPVFRGGKDAGDFSYNLYSITASK